MVNVGKWSVKQVCDWVASLEGPLKDYRNAFEEHEVDGAVLCQLDDTKLEKLGIKKSGEQRPQGHQCKLLDAIKVLKCSNPGETSVKHKAPARPSPPAPGPGATNNKGGAANVDNDVDDLIAAMNKNLQLGNKKIQEAGAAVDIKAAKAAQAAKPANSEKPAKAAKAANATKTASSALQAPERVLVIEAFAGSHPAARHIQQLLAQPQAAPYRVTGYAAVEERQPVGEKFRAPAPEALGLTPKHYLSLHARVEDAATKTQLLGFVRRELQSSNLAQRPTVVVVFGGPPCKKYCNAAPQYWGQQKALSDAEASYEQAQKQLSQLQTKAGAGRAQAQRKVEEAEHALKAAQDDVDKHKREVQAADDLVSSLLALSQDIQKDCKAAPGGKVTCHVVMENPYSCKEKALWNRPFMKESHLINLPDTKIGAKVTREEGFRASSSAWLNTLWQNWCTDGPGYPQIDSIIFTTLSRQALPARHCSKECQRPNKTENHPETVCKKGDRAYESAQWPTEFVGAVLRACVGSKDPYAGL